MVQDMEYVAQKCRPSTQRVIQNQATINTIIKNEVRRGLECLGGRLAAMLAHRGAHEPEHVRKPRSRSPEDPALGNHFLYFL